MYANPIPASQGSPSSSHLVNIATHPLKLGLACAHQIPDLPYILHIFVAREFSLCIGDGLCAPILGDAVEGADDAAVEAEDALALEEVL